MPKHTQLSDMRGMRVILPTLLAGAAPNRGHRLQARKPQNLDRRYWLLSFWFSFLAISLAIALARGVDVLVATPGRLIDHLGERNISCAETEIFVMLFRDAVWRKMAWTRLARRAPGC